MKKYLIIPLAALFTLGACVSKKVFRQSQMETAVLRQDSVNLANSNATLEGKIAVLNKNIKTLNSDIASLNNQNGQLGQETANQQNQLSKSKEELQAQQQRLIRLQSLLEQQRTQAKALKDKMTDALKGFNSDDLSVVQKNGKVYVSLSENLLFPSGSSVVNPKGIVALSRLASVLNMNTDVSVNIEGHTDSIPIRGRFKDNWDLSTARANAIVRVLVDTYKVDPVRVVASGHSYFDPLNSNASAEGRARNRRTEIILSPKLEEMYRLIEM